MNRLFMLAVACIFFTLTPIAIANEQTSNATNLAPIKTVASVYSTRHWYEKEDQLVGRSGRDSGHRERRIGCSTGSPYAGLRVTTNTANVYGQLSPGCYEPLRSVKSTAEEELNSPRTKTLERSATWVRVTNKDEVSHLQPTDWPSNKIGAINLKLDDYDCNKCDDCKCPPFVCERKLCKKNYAVVFGAKWCRYCPKMYPVVKQLRKDGYFVIYIDTDQYPKVVHKFQLKSWPTTIVMDHGKEQIRFSGVTTIRKINKFLTKTRKEQTIKDSKKKEET